MSAELSELQLNAKLSQKIAKVTEAAGRVPKNGFNEHFKYKFATESDVLDAVRAACIESNLTIVPSILGIEQTPTGSNSRSGAPLFRSRVQIGYDLIDCETGFVRTLVWFGECIEAEDKGINKAITSCGKYFLLKAFMIPTGDDPDAGAPTGAKAPKAQPAAKESKKQELPPHGAYLKSIGLNPEQFEAFKQSCIGRGHDFRSVALWCERQGCSEYSTLMATAVDYDQFDDDGAAPEPTLKLIPGQDTRLRTLCKDAGIEYDKFIAECNMAGLTSYDQAKARLDDAMQVTA